MRYATPEEVKIYRKINSLLREDSDLFDRVNFAVNDLIFSYGEERKQKYRKVYYLANKLSVKVSELEIWYCVG